MKAPPKLRGDLVLLRNLWKAKQDEFSKAMLNDRHDKQDRSRYEGLATAFRWCLEDLNDVLEGWK